MCCEEGEEKFKQYEILDLHQQLYSDYGTSFIHWAGPTEIQVAGLSPVRSTEISL